MSKSQSNNPILLRNANLAPMHLGIGEDSLLRKTCLLINDGKIIWIGNENDLPTTLDLPASMQTIDCSEQWIMPGFIDCHTHLVFAGNRANEFEKRLNGVSYKEIAEQGGGILNTVNATRSATQEDLFKLGKKRAQAMLKKA